MVREVFSPSAKFCSWTMHSTPYTLLPAHLLCHGLQHGLQHLLYIGVQVVRHLFRGKPEKLQNNGNFADFCKNLILWQWIGSRLESPEQHTPAASPSLPRAATLKSRNHVSCSVLSDLVLFLPSARHYFKGEGVTQSKDDRNHATSGKEPGDLKKFPSIT